MDHPLNPILLMMRCDYKSNLSFTESEGDSDLSSPNELTNLSAHLLRTSSLTCTGANQHHLFLQLCPDVRSIHLQDQRDDCMVTV